MGFQVLGGDSVDRAKWDRLAEKSETGTFYHLWVWGQIWEKGFKASRTLYFVSQDGEDYALGLPVIQIRKKGLSSFFSMPMGTYGGLLHLGAGAESIGEFHSKVLKEVPSLTALKFQIVDWGNHYPFLAGLGFQKKETATQMIDLKEENLERLLEKRGYQQSLAKEITVRKISGQGEVRICHDLYNQTSRRHSSTSKYPLRFYQTLFELGRDSDWLLWWVAESQGSIIGYQINFDFKDQLHFWDAGSQEEALQHRPNDAMMGKSLLWCGENNVRFYNLGGSPAEAEGLKRFKQEWGGKEKKYFTYQKTYPLGRLVQAWRGA